MNTLSSPRIARSLQAGIAVLTSSVVLFGANAAPAEALSATDGLKCAPTEVMSGGLCMENPRGYPIIPSENAELAALVTPQIDKMGNLICEGAFSTAACGPGVTLWGVTPAIVQLEEYVYVASSDCYLYDPRQEVCVDPNIGATLPLAP